MNEEELFIHTDGGARGNPGPAACAFIAEYEGRIIKKGSCFLGNSTNNYAEYQGVILALKWLIDNTDKYLISKILFYSDSELVVRQLNCDYKVKDKKLLELFIQVNDLSKSINTKMFYKNIPRNKNILADFLVNKELDENTKI